MNHERVSEIRDSRIVVFYAKVPLGRGGSEIPLVSCTTKKSLQHVIHLRYGQKNLGERRFILSNSCSTRMSNDPKTSPKRNLIESEDSRKIRLIYVIIDYLFVWEVTSHQYETSARTTTSSHNTTRYFGWSSLHWMVPYQPWCLLL